MIYFAQAENGHIKIGFSSNVRTRIRALQGQVPLRVTLLKTVIGSRRLEGQLHQKFASTRLWGEWFQPSEELLTFIETIVEDKRALPPNKPGPKGDADHIPEQTNRAHGVVESDCGRIWTPRQVAAALAVDLEEAMDALKYLADKGRICRGRNSKEFYARKLRECAELARYDEDGE
jgi:hypothetical protein